MTTVSGSHFVRFFSWLGILLLVAACGPGSNPAPTPTVELLQPPPSPTQTATAPVSAPADPTPTPEAAVPGAAATAPALLRAHYTLDAVFEYDQHHLSVREQIAYTNNSTATLTDLLLMVDALYYPGVFTLNTMTWQDGTPVQDIERETGRIRLPLPVPLPPGGSLGLSIEYELQLPSPQASAEVRPIPFGYTARQANLVDWYPFIPPYSEQAGWLAHNAGFFGEHLVYEPADFTVSLSLGNSRPGLTIAASAAASLVDGVYHYEHPNARNFVFSASPEYEVLTASVGETIVTGYAFSIHRSAGQAVLDTTARAMDLYNRLYAPYPRRLLSVVEADFLDGMEYDGLYFLSNGFYNLYQGTPGEYLIAIAAHETAHQWFYALVGNDQALEPWLDEALCTYSERLFYEHTAPEALAWWWDYRVNYYDPQGPVNGSIYNPAGYRPYRDAVYLNGALFMEDLRSLIGDDAFFEFIRDYVHREAGQIATAQSFFSILKEHTQVDFSPLVSKYFSQP